MVTKPVIDLLNLQVNREFYSAYLYLEMANFYQDAGLAGYANWFEVQAKEEQDHAMGFIRYLQHIGAKVVLAPIDNPTRKFKNFREPLEEALKHEKFVTASIENILEVAIKEKDYLTQNFIQWYIKEQGEEEKNANDNLLAIDFVGDDKAALIKIDHFLREREYHPSLPDLD
ncbi:MAG: ferritin [Erysipelotrichaceae bacterium]|nr:ferritin [Erysipelotrichaceae bacterium]